MAVEKKRICEAVTLLKQYCKKAEKVAPIEGSVF